jgi:hypothetical protein
MMIKVDNICFKDELKSIFVCELYYRVAMDIASLLPKTKVWNKYILVAINCYSKWCKAKAVTNHGVKTIAKFLEDDVICRYGVPKFVLIDNGGEWGEKFDVMCKDNSIHHQHTTSKWTWVMGWLNSWSKLLNMASPFFLQHHKIWTIGMNNRPKSCLDIDVGFRLTPSFYLSW